MALTAYGKKIILDHLLLGVPFVVDAFYLGLHLTDPASGGVSGEVSAGDYQRQQVLFNSSYQNTNEILFGPAASTWGNVTYVALHDAVTGGNTINSQSITAVNVVQLVTVKFAVGGLTFP